jgi:hypothetical protein
MATLHVPTEEGQGVYNDRMTANDELERTWKESILACLKYYPSVF